MLTSLALDSADVYRPHAVSAEDFSCFLTRSAFLHLLPSLMMALGDYYMICGYGNYFDDQFVLSPTFEVYRVGLSIRRTAHITRRK